MAVLLNEELDLTSITEAFPNAFTWPVSVDATGDKREASWALFIA